MPGLQGEASEIEQPTHESKRGFDKATLWTATISGFSLSVVIWKLWQDDATKLLMLHTFMNLFRALAGFFGSWALAFEAYYYDYVSTLH